MSRRTQKNVGVIGLGIIGSRVAENVRRRGFHVFVWNRTPRPFPNFVGSRAEVAEICDFIQIFVSDDDALLESIEQIKRVLKPHHIVMAHCTVAPHTMRAAAEIVQRKGAQFLDAPFTGSKIAAKNGELVYYIGGDAATFERARPVLQASSKQIIEIGEIGQATTIKVATNMITATTVQATAEALALVHSAGLTPDKFALAMEGNGSNSGTLAMKLPNMISGNFEPHFSTKHMLKDVQIASRLARSNDLNFGAMEAARDSLRKEVEQGRGDYDYASMVRVYFPDGIPKHAAAEVAADDQQDLAALHGAAEIESPNGATGKPQTEPEPVVPEEPAPAALPADAEPIAELAADSPADSPADAEPIAELAVGSPADADAEPVAAVTDSPAEVEARVVDSPLAPVPEEVPALATPGFHVVAKEERSGGEREPEAIVVIAKTEQAVDVPQRGFLHRVFGRSND
ncbi:MAG: NAD(P)-dependent oxidoreductase [Chthoniobacterales bacterium]